MNIVIGNGTSPTSADTASLLSAVSVNSEVGPAKASDSSKKSIPDTQTASSALSPIKAVGEAGAPIATIEGQEDDLKLDGGEVTSVVTSPPSCTRLSDQSQACVWWRPGPAEGEAELCKQLPPKDNPKGSLQQGWR